MWITSFKMCSSKSVVEITSFEFSFCFSSFFEFSYDQCALANHSMKWVFANDLNLVFVAVYLNISQVPSLDIELACF